MKGCLFIIAAPSGAGKTTLVRELLVADDFILVYKKGNRTGIMEQNGKILLDSDYNNIHRLEVGKKNYFLGIDEKGRQTLLTSDYKKVLGMDFDKVEGYSGFIRLKDGEFYGLANTEGLLILPVQYKEIIISQSLTENIIYAKKTTTFLAFSEGGERMHQKDCMHPTESRKKYYLPYGKKGEAQTVLVYDGTEVKAPMNWGTRFPMDVIDGVRYVIIGTKAVQEPHFVSDLCMTFPGHVIVGLDARDGKVAVDGWSKLSKHDVIDIAQRFERDGVEAISRGAHEPPLGAEMDREHLAERGIVFHEEHVERPAHRPHPTTDYPRHGRCSTVATKSQHRADRLAISWRSPRGAGVRDEIVVP